MKRATLQALVAARAQRRTLVRLTSLTTGAERLLDPNQLGAEPAELAQSVRRAVLRDRSERIELADGPALLHVFSPRLRLLVIGAVHIAQSLVQFGMLDGFDVSVIDPRRAFATAERFPGVHLVHAWPARALEQLGVDARCALVTLTHDPKLDDPALEAGLRAGAFYVGALGSRRTHQARLQRLRERGLSDQQLARIHAPVGLDLGAVSPAEIATSIIAQVIETLRRSPP